MFVTKLIIAFAGLMPLAPVIDTAPSSSTLANVEEYAEALPDFQHCYDVVVDYNGTAVTVSACGDTPQRALNRLGAAVRRLSQSQ